jgi:hypothetical protein
LSHPVTAFVTGNHADCNLHQIIGQRRQSYGFPAENARSKANREQEWGKNRSAPRKSRIAGSTDSSAIGVPTGIRGVFEKWWNCREVPAVFKRPPAAEPPRDDCFAPWREIPVCRPISMRKSLFFDKMDMISRMARSNSHSTSRSSSRWTDVLRSLGPYGTGDRSRSQGVALGYRVWPPWGHGNFGCLLPQRGLTRKPRAIAAPPWEPKK